MKNINDLYFEELEKIEELDAVSDFAGAAAPWVFGSITLAVALAT